ncbi:MAG: GspE/PulE family protein [Bacillota bacterium]|nr:GspE/PulE family protein [Bacillota bacterium]
MIRERAKMMGEMLLEEGLITQDQLNEALRIQKTTRQKLGEILIEGGVVTEDQILDMLGKQYHLPFIDLTKVAVQPEAAASINVNLARKYTLIPVKREDPFITIATADPLDFYALDDIRVATGLIVKPVIAFKKQILEAIEKNYAGHTARAAAHDLRLESKEEKIEETDLLLEGVNRAPVVRLVQSIIQYAVKKNASDIHIEPLENELRVRVRIDGELQETMRTPIAAHSAVTTRIKIMGKMDIAEKRIPQDGRINDVIEGKNIDMRISVMPTVYGEKIVIRLLNKSDALITKKNLGLTPENEALLDMIIKNPHGMLLVTGPTGSGKTTTLYAILKEINAPTRNILTIEDPVEYEIPGVNHTQVNVKAGLTFASGLRAILRQDPDIVMVGEIRDSETAQIAVRAAITGHLVLSTLHTNDAASTITRLVDMGTEPFLVSSSLVGIIAQRLVRKLCSSCREACTPSGSEMKLLDISAPQEIFKPKGCNLCNFTGFKGRMAIFEIIVVDRKIRDMINAGANADEIRDEAIKAGTKTLRQNCAGLVLNGTTSISELLKATYEVD